MRSHNKHIPHFPFFLCIIVFLSQTVCSPSAPIAGEQDKMLWNKKYEPEAYIFGKEPVAFLKEHIKLLPRGKVLDIAMGEGRNAIFLAKNGFEVDGCDISERAIEKALSLAKENKVQINASVADLETFLLPQETYDVIACFYYLQRNLIPQIKKALKPGGFVIFETYTVENLDRGFEGPKNRDYLLKTNELLNFFRDFKIILYRENILDNKKAVASLIAQKLH